MKALPKGRALSALLLPVSFPPLFLPRSGTCQLHGPFSHHSSQVYVTWAPVYDTECGCWVFPHSPWHSGPSHPPSACPGTPWWVALSPTHTSFPINTGLGPSRSSHCGGRQHWTWQKAGRLCLWKQNPQPSSLSLSEPQTAECVYFLVCKIYIT